MNAAIPEPNPPFDCLRKLDDWIALRLPLLNAQIDSGNLADIENLRVEAVRLIQEVTNICDCSRVGFADGCRLIGNLGLITASSYKHHLPENSELVNLAKGLAQRVAACVGHPPRDSVYTYIVFNTPHPRSGRFRAFTASQQEQDFIASSATAISLYEKAVRYLRNFNSNGSDMFARLGAAEEALDGIASEYARFLRPETITITSEWFSQIYKPYFPEYSIEGVSWEPPSGAHIPSVIELDLRLGCKSEADIVNVRQHHRYLLDHHRQALEAAILEPTIGNLLQQAPVPVRILKAVGKVMKAFAKASTVHWAVVSRYLERRSEEGKHIMPYAQVKGMSDGRRHNDILLRIERVLGQYDDEDKLIQI